MGTPVKQNRSPVVDKTMILLGLIASRKAGVSLANLVEAAAVPRSTVYRILNSLIAHRFVVRQEGGLFTLGPRMREMAGAWQPETDWGWLTRLAAPYLQDLGASVGEASKIAVREGDEIVTIYSVPSKAEYGLAVRVGHRGPLHVGGAGKAVLAFAPTEDIERIVSSPLQAFTPATITNADTLRDVLSRIRQQGYAEDFGEMTVGIRSFAAPVFDAGGGVLGAISVPFIGEAVPERAHSIQQAVVAAASEITNAVAPGARRARRLGV